MSQRENIIFRVKIIWLFLLFIGLLIFGKIIYLNFFIDDEILDEATNTSYRETVMSPKRGDILAQDGKILATSVPYYTVAIDINTEGITKTVFNENIDSLAYCLANLFQDKTKEQYLNILKTKRDKGSRYYVINKYTTHEELTKIKTFPILRRGQYKGGLIFNSYNKREMPFGKLCRRTIGLVSKDKDIGLFGLEKEFNSELFGLEGLTVEKKSSGGIFMPIKTEARIEPRDGMDVTTTIDIDIQDVAETALEERLKHHNAHHGSVIVMEVKTGKIKAIANLSRREDGEYSETYNYAVGEATDPGSTFKLASVMAALEDGVTSADDIVDTRNGTRNFYGSTMRDSHHGGYGKISLHRAFEVSSNVGISSMIDKYYRDDEQRFIDRLMQMNIGKKTDICIPGEAEPVLRSPESKQWSKISLPWISIGYEVELSPLQILTFYNAVANKGKMMKPMLVENIQYNGTHKKTFKPTVLKSTICSRKTIDIVHEMLVGVVENGTATNLKNNNYKIAGKTGTAQVGYGGKKSVEYSASFAGYFPADNPKYSCIVVVNRPDKSTGFYGNTVAGPVLKKIADKIHASDSELRTEKFVDSVLVIPNSKKGNRQDFETVLNWFNIPTNNKSIRDCDWVQANTKNDKVNYSIRAYSNKNIVPNILGMSAKDAIIVSEKNGLTPEIYGRGKVVKQIPKNGSNIHNADTLKIFLK